MGLLASAYMGIKVAIKAVETAKVWIDGIAEIAPHVEEHLHGVAQIIADLGQHSENEGIMILTQYGSGLLNVAGEVAGTMGEIAGLAQDILDTASNANTEVAGNARDEIGALESAN